MRALKSNGRPEGEILITYGVLRVEAGWVPWVADDDGRRHGFGFGSPSDRDEALTAARERAEELASRYIGDWKVTIEEVVE